MSNTSKAVPAIDGLPPSVHPLHSLVPVQVPDIFVWVRSWISRRPIKPFSRHLSRGVKRGHNIFMRLSWRQPKWRIHRIHFKRVPISHPEEKQYLSPQLFSIVKQKIRGVYKLLYQCMMMSVGISLKVHIANHQYRYCFRWIDSYSIVFS